MLQVAGCNKALNGTQFGRLDKRGTICPLILTHYQNMDLYFHGSCFADNTKLFDLICFCCKHLLCFGILTHFCWEPGESQSLEGRIALMWCQLRSETKKISKDLKTNFKASCFQTFTWSRVRRLTYPFKLFCHFSIFIVPQFGVVSKVFKSAQLFNSKSSPFVNFFSSCLVFGYEAVNLEICHMLNFG